MLTIPKVPRSESYKEQIKRPGMIVKPVRKELVQMGRCCSSSSRIRGKPLLFPCKFVATCNSAVSIFWAGELRAMKKAHYGASSAALQTVKVMEAAATTEIEHFSYPPLSLSAHGRIRRSFFVQKIQIQVMRIGASSAGRQKFFGSPSHFLPLFVGHTTQCSSGILLLRLFTHCAVHVYTHFNRILVRSSGKNAKGKNEIRGKNSPT